MVAYDQAGTYVLSAETNPGYYTVYTDQKGRQRHTIKPMSAIVDQAEKVTKSLFSKQFSKTYVVCEAPSATFPSPDRTKAGAGAHPGHHGPQGRGDFGAEGLFQGGALSGPGPGLLGTAPTTDSPPRRRICIIPAERSLEIPSKFSSLGPDAGSSVIS